MYYPPVGFHFKVTFKLDGITENDFRFQEVGGLNAEISTESLTEGGENRFSHKLPLRANYGNLILKRGMLTDSKLISWFSNAIENFAFDPIEVDVFLLNEKHEALASWNFTKVWPVKWSVTDFKATENTVASETIELAYNYFRRVK